MKVPQFYNIYINIYIYIYIYIYIHMLKERKRKGGIVGYHFAFESFWHGRIIS